MSRKTEINLHLKKEVVDTAISVINEHPEVNTQYLANKLRDKVPTLTPAQARFGIQNARKAVSRYYQDSVKHLNQAKESARRYQDELDVTNQELEKVRAKMNEFRDQVRTLKQQLDEYNKQPSSYAPPSSLKAYREEFILVCENQFGVNVDVVLNGFTD